MISERFLKCVIVSMFLIASVLLYVFIKDLMWDEVVYIMMGKYIAGNKLIFENIRPPAYPLMLSILSCLKIEFLSKFIPFIFYGMLSLFTYLLAERLFTKKVALYSALFTMANPLVIQWSPRILTEIPSTCFILLALFYLWDALSSKKAASFYLACFFSSLTFLMKFPMALIAVAVYAIYVLDRGFFNSLKSRGLYVSLLFFLAPIVIAFLLLADDYGSFFPDFIAAYMIPAGTKSPLLTYFINMPVYFQLEFGLVLLAVVYFYRKPSNYESKKIFFISLPMLLIFLFFSLFSFKEGRYLIPMIPLVGILTSYLLLFNAKFYLDKIFFIITISSFILSLCGNIFYPLQCDNKAIEQASEMVKGSKGHVISNQWPLVSYYAGIPSRSFPEEVGLIENDALFFNATYFVVSDRPSWPAYISNKSLLDGLNYTAYMQTFKDSCGSVYVYFVNQTLINRY